MTSYSQTVIPVRAFDDKASRSRRYLGLGISLRLLGFFTGPNALGAAFLGGVVLPKMRLDAAASGADGPTPDGLFPRPPALTKREFLFHRLTRIGRLGQLGALRFLGFGVNQGVPVPDKAIGLVAPAEDIRGFPPIMLLVDRAIGGD